jgi:mono/diheme cytochrome c family protein
MTRASRELSWKFGDPFASFRPMRFLRDALITILVLVVIVSVVAYSRVRAGGLSAEAEPGRVERAIASRLARLSIPSDAKQQANPFRADTTVWRTAADHYGDHCAGCHGPDGHGKTVVGQAMYPKTPDFADPTVQGRTDGELFYVIQNGVRWTGMPAWKHEHSPDDTWRLVSFIRAVPTLTRADLQSVGLDSSTEHHEPHQEH